LKGRAGCGAPQYVTQTDEGGWRVSGTRVSLESVVCAFPDGLSPEEIVAQFPALSLEKAYGAIAYYLKHRDEIDRYVAEHAQEWERLRVEQSKRSDALLERIRSARASTRNPRKSGSAGLNISPYSRSSVCDQFPH